MPEPQNAESAPKCNHPGGFRADTGEWECSRCGKRFPSYEAWGEATGNYEAVAAVKSAIAADLAGMAQIDSSGARS